MNDDRTHDPTRPMTLARFGALADAYGGAIERWPEAERRAARGLLAASQPARETLAAAQHLDAALDRLPAPPPASARLRRSVAALKPAPEPPRHAGGPRPRKRTPLPVRGLAMAATAAAGIWTGIALAPGPERDPESLALIEAALIVGEAPATVVAHLMEEF